MRVMAAGAHPDDVDIFMGGALLAWRDMGATTRIVVATDGAKGGRGDPAALAARRSLEAEAAAAVLGSELSLLGLPDGGLSAEGPALARALGGEIAAFRPDVVVTHAGNDYHGDHRNLSLAVAAAAGFAAPVLFCDTVMGVGFLPTHYVDVTAQFDRKVAAIRCHDSQDPERFVEMMRLQNAFRAAQMRAAPGSMAEAYRVEPVYPFSDVRALLPPPPTLAPVADRGAAT